MWKAKSVSGSLFVRCKSVLLLPFLHVCSLARRLCISSHQGTESSHSLESERSYTFFVRHMCWMILGLHFHRCCPCMASNNCLDTKMDWTFAVIIPAGSHMATRCLGGQPVPYWPAADLHLLSYWKQPIAHTWLSNHYTSLPHQKFIWPR